MKIAIFGLGYVGLTAAACLVRQGHSVCGVDIDRNKTEAVGAGRSPIKEPGLQELLAEGVGRQLLTTANDGSAAAAAADAVMICVGTPSTPDGAHNMDHVVKVTREIAEALEADPACSPTLIYRSTFRPGTTEGLILPILRAALGESRMDGIEVVHNPEFLRESTAIRDYFNPPKIVVGTSHGGPSPAMDRLYQGIAAPVFHTPYRVSELIKLVDNTWHATKVAFANEMGRIAINLGLDPGTIHQLFVADTKLNISATYLRPGGPFGGSCLPKDVKALQQIALDAGASTTLIDSLVRSNDAHKYFVFEQCTNLVEPGAPILMVGLAFKDGSDDLRDSPNVDLARRILDAGYRLSIYDPYLCPDQLIGQNLGYSAIHLPNLRSLLVSREEVEASEYEVIVDTNGTSASLNGRSRRVVNLHALSRAVSPDRKEERGGARADRALAAVNGL